VFFAFLSLALILVVVDATSLYIERKRLFTLADGAALVGAEAFTIDSVTVTSSGPRPTLQPADVSAAVTAYLAGTPDPGFDDLRVDRATTDDGASATVTLSSAQILDLHNTPITVVAAPGAGKYIAVHKVVAYLNHVTTDYVSSSGDLSVCYSGEEADPYSTVNLQRSADHIAVEAVQQMSLPAASMVNVAIVAAANGSVFTLGDGTLPITVWYTIEDVPA